jgi:hypothetical protein
VNSDVAFTKRAENRIGNGVCECIGIRVTISAAI